MWRDDLGCAAMVRVAGVYFDTPVSIGCVEDIQRYDTKDA